jgi:hypothetical protein
MLGHIQSIAAHPLVTGVALLVCVAFRPAHGVVFAADDPVFGAGALTVNDAAGLGFLDLTFSTSRSYNDVSTEFGPGGDFEGFRYASVGEVINLFQEWGIPVITVSGPFIHSPANIGPAQSLIALIGQTSDQAGNPEAHGVTGTSSGFGSRARASLDFFFAGAGPGYGVGSAGSQGSQAFFSTFGSWLVKPFTSSVPEPTSWMLLGIGLAVVGLGRRRSTRSG